MHLRREQEKVLILGIRAIEIFLRYEPVACDTIWIEGGQSQRALKRLKVLEVQIISIDNFLITFGLKPDSANNIAVQALFTNQWISLQIEMNLSVGVRAQNDIEEACLTLDQTILAPTKDSDHVRQVYDAVEGRYV